MNISLQRTHGRRDCVPPISKSELQADGAISPGRVAVSATSYQTAPHARSQRNWDIRTFCEILVAAGFLAWCGALIAVRVGWTGKLWYAFLAGNLFLAAIPFGLSLIMQRVRRSRAMMFLFPLWLLFFPNAPYLLTDLLHLGPQPDAPLWYDMLLLWSAAFAGLYLTYASLRHVQSLVIERYGALIGWLSSVVLLFVAAFGVTLGRFQRWNSWEIVSSPLALAEDILKRLLIPWHHPRTWGMTLGMGMLLTLGYLGIALLALAPQQKSAREI